MFAQSSRQNPKTPIRRRAALAAAMVALLGLATTGASATAIGTVTHIVALPAPFSHSVFINNDAGNLDHRMSLPTSSTSVKFLLPPEVATLNITNVGYSLYGENFTVGGTASLDAQKRSVVISLPVGFFSVTPGHRPLIGPSDENGVPLHAAGYYGFELTATGPSAQPPRLGLGSGDLLSVTAVVERGTNTGARTPVFSLDRDDVDSVNTRKQYFSSPTQTVRTGDRVAVTGSRGFWDGTSRPFLSRQVALGSDLNEDSLENLLLPKAVSADGSRITVTVRDRSSSDSDIDVQPGAAPLIAITMLTGVPFGPGGADHVAVYVPVRTAPGAPTIATPTAGQSSATVRWTAPTSGGAAILGYRVRAYVGAKLVRTKLVVGPAKSAVVTGLRNGTGYTFDVAAVNRVGIGPVWKRSAVVTPRG